MSIIDEQLATISGPQREALEHLRSVVHQAAPGAEEVITYAMPGFKYHGKYLCSFAAFKDHLSFFPGAMPIAVIANDLGEFKTSKGTIQFTPDHPIPDELLTRLIKLRLEAIASTSKRASYI